LRAMLGLDGGVLVCVEPVSPQPPVDDVPDGE
jgi:hypothetical protein